MSMARYIGLGKESTFGTAVAASKYVDVQDEDIKSAIEWIDQEGVADRGGIRKSDIGFKSGEGGWNMYVEPENGITRVLDSLIAPSVDTLVEAAISWDHTFDPIATEADLASLTLRKGLVDVEVVAPGRMIDNAEFAYKAGDYLMARVETVGKFEDVSTASIGSPSFSAKKAFVGRSGTITVDAVAKDILAATVKISRQFETDDAVIGQDSYKRALKDTRLLVEGVLDWLDFAAAERTKFVNGTIGTLVLKATGAALGVNFHELELTMNEVQYREFESNMSGREVRRMSTPFMALIDPTDGRSIRARVRNGEATVI